MQIYEKKIPIKVVKPKNLLECTQTGSRQCFYSPVAGETCTAVDFNCEECRQRKIFIEKEKNDKTKKVKRRSKGIV